MKLSERLKIFLHMFGRKGAPFLSLIATTFTMVGGVIAWCRPGIVGSSSGSGRGLTGSTMAGNTCGNGGSAALVFGLGFVAVGVFLLIVAYRVTKELAEENGKIL